VGEENEGWTYAKFLLAHERTNIAGIGSSKRELRRLKRMAQERRRAGKPLLQDPVFADRIAEVELELAALEVTNLRVLSEKAGNTAPGPEASILKIRGTEIMQRISELQVEALGRDALSLSPRPGVDPTHAPRAASAYLNLRKLSIFGGSNEIQRNIIAQMILKLRA
jgi:alkylation response protein AidB-like acyl-CoA dehydrogenase